MHGETSLEYAHVLVLYGKTLLASGIQQNSILAQERVGQAMDAGEAEQIDLQVFLVACVSITISLGGCACGCRS